MNYLNNRNKKSFLSKRGGDIAVGGAVFAGCFMLIVLFLLCVFIVPIAGGYILNWIWPQTFTFWQGFALTFVVSCIFGVRVKTK